MNTVVRKVLAILEGHPLVSDVKIIRLDETPTGHLECKVRCRITGGQQFQVWLHQSAHTTDYAYQLFTSVPLLRWDNAPHYPGIETAPHHFHDEQNNVGSSPLTGQPSVDLPIVLEVISQRLGNPNTVL